MFDKIPTSPPFPAKPSYCSCSLGTSTHHLLSHHLGSRSHSEMASSCKDVKHIHFSSLIPDLDINSEYINSEALIGKINLHAPTEESNLNVSLQEHVHPSLPCDSIPFSCPVLQALLEKEPMLLRTASCMYMGVGSSTGAWITSQRPPTLRKANSSSSSSHELPAAPQLGVVLHELLPNPCWGWLFLFSGLILYKCCVCTWSQFL